MSTPTEQEAKLAGAITLMVKLLVNAKLDRKTVEDSLKVAGVWDDRVSPIVLDGAVEFICRLAQDNLNSSKM